MAEAQPQAETINYRGQLYERIGGRPYQCKDGRIVQLAEWRSRCANCSEPFSFSRPANSPRFNPNRRCQKCKRRGVRVKSISRVRDASPQDRPVEP